MAVRVQAEPFDLAHEVGLLRAGRKDAGAIVSFTGAVRNAASGPALIALTLEHYPGMTEAELARVEAQARQRWQLQDCLIIHRFGRLEPGDDIVLVVTLSEHRQAAFAAADFLMDYLKTSAPFWKQEQLADGTRGWIEAKVSDEAAASRWKPSDSSSA